MSTYKANIKITLRAGILDVQGKAVESGLHSISLNQITNVRIGKYVELMVEAADQSSAQMIVDDACRQLIANPIIEDYFIELIEI